MKKKTSGIYMIRNLVNSKVYVGRSKNIEHRWREHLSEARKLRRNFNQLYADINELGEDKFELTILCECTENMSYWELLYILEKQAFYPLGYNKGDTHSGWMSAKTFELLPEDLQIKWKKFYSESGQLGIESLKNLRKNPTYEIGFLKIKSQASRNREANIKARRAIDKDYDNFIHHQRSQATSNRVEGYQYKGSIVFKERMKTDLEFAKKVKENRARAARIGWERRKNGGMA